MELILRYLHRVGFPADPRDRAFHTFARLEHAMRLSGFEHRHNNRRADTDWGKLARELGGTLREESLSEPGQRAVLYLINEPPKRELIGEAGPEWEQEEINAATTIERAILHVRRVRNNLVHGGKVNYRPERDGLLLESSLAVIEELLLAHERLQATFLAK